MEVNFRFELTEEQKSKWTEFWSTSQHTYPRQHPVFAEIERGVGRIPIFVSGEVDGAIVCLGIFSIRPLLWSGRFSLEAYCLRGPMFDNVEFFKEFIQCVIAHFKKLGVGSVRISPYWQFPEAEKVESALAELGFLPYNSGEGSRSCTGFVDLMRSEDEILASFSQNTRRKIRQVEHSGVAVGPARTWEEAKRFLEALNKMSLDRGICRMQFREFEGTYKHVLRKQELGILVTAVHDSVFLGGILVIREPSIAHSPNIVVNREGLSEFRNLTATPAIFWYGLRWAKERGCRWFDVEGYSENTEKTSNVYRIHESKKKFLPVPVKIISEHICVCNGVTYSIYEGHRFFLRGCRFLRSLPYRTYKRLRSNVPKT